MWEHPGPVDAPSLDIDQALGTIAARTPAPGGGSVAALVGAMAAALCTKVARLSADGGAAAQAEARRRALAALASEDAEAFAAAVAELHTRGGDIRLGRALGRAAEVPLQIAAACTDVAELASGLASSGKPELEPDARCAALLAAAAAEAAAVLVEANLGATPGDERVARAHELAATAAAAARA
jgi:formiminotetrahydrofolate cyclodeaminase